MNKGKLISKSSPPRISGVANGIFLFVISAVGGCLAIYAWIISPIPNDISFNEQLYYYVARIIMVLGLFGGGFYGAYWYWKFGFNIYENGVTKPYSNFFNWLFHNNRKEGIFIPYQQILGYLTVQDFENLDYKKWKKKGKDGVFVVYFDSDKGKIRFTLYGENARDV